LWQGWVHHTYAGATEQELALLLPSHVLIASRHPSPTHRAAHLHILIQLPQSVEAAWQRLNIAQGTVVVAHVLTHEVLQNRKQCTPTNRHDTAPEFSHTNKSRWLYYIA
jgi:hypothetical protein